MLIAQKPENELERLDSLLSYSILDSPEEELFDEITKIASYICKTPISLVSLIDESRQWFKSHHGLDARETPREYAFCSHAILNDELFIVENAKEDKRFFDNPLVLEDPNVVFYAGYPLEMDGKYKIGTLCVIDHVPRVLDEEQKELLKSLAGQIVQLIGMRRINHQLAIEKDIAVKANAAKRDFISAISHDIRNPLNSLLGTAEMIREHDLDSALSLYVDQIQNAGEVILHLVNDTIELSKLEDSILSSYNDWFFMNPFLFSTEKFFSWEAKRKNIHFSLSGNGLDNCFVFSDQRKIEKIIHNLIANALKFTNKGSVVCSVSLNQTPNNSGEELFIKVTDTGPGIPNEVKEKLFQKYNTFTPEGCLISGSGLGLSIVKISVESLFGEITVTSDPGKGTQFVVTLPIQTKKKTEQNLEASKNTKENFPSFTKPLHVLIADDNAVNRMVLRNYLKPFPFEITETEDGQETEDTLQKSNFSIAFLDIEMPKKHGTEIAKNIRGNKNAPILIACTGLCMPEEKQKILGSGFEFFFPKPYIKEELYTILSEITKRII